MEIHHTEIAFIGILLRDPLAQRPKIIANGEIPGRLNT
jgi:hypothetical protein